MIYDNQINQGNAIFTVSEGVVDIHQGKAYVQNAGNVFENIALPVKQVSSQVKEVSQDIKSIFDNSQAIVLAVSQTEQVSQNTCANTQEVSAAAWEQSAEMTEMTSASKVLVNMAEET